MNYTAQLNDTRWKVKRKKILERDNFACVDCLSTKHLHVHHIKYTGFAWQAPNGDLITLCQSCHMKLHRNKLKVRHNFDGVIIKSENFDLYSIGATNEDIPFLLINQYGPNAGSNALKYFISDLRVWEYDR